MSGAANLLKRSISSIVTLIVGVLVFLSIPGQIAVFDSEGQSSVNARTVPYLITSLIIIISLIMIISEGIKFRKEESDVSKMNRENRQVIFVFFSPFQRSHCG